MYIRVTISAVIGKHRESYAVGASLASDGKFYIDINKDVDWSRPIFMILEPDDKVDFYAKSYGMAMETAMENGHCYNCWLIGGKHADDCTYRAKE